MFDPFIDWLVTPYLAKKATDSRNWNIKAELKPLPTLGKAGFDGLVPLETINRINAQLGNLPYRADPWNFDHYTKPGYLQWALEAGKWDGISCDCDDFAIYAWALLRECGMDMSRVRIANLILTPGPQYLMTMAFHVVLLVPYFDGKKTWTAVLDTNSAGDDVLWFSGSNTERDILTHFSGVYRTQYYRIVDAQYPF